VEALADVSIAVIALVLLAKMFIWPAKKLEKKVEEAAKEFTTENAQSKTDRKGDRTRGK
jgi:hypothetical protein